MTAESTEGSRGPYAKTARVRQRILDASISSFAERGFRATTMKDVADRSGLSERGLSHYFETKAELLATVLAQHEAENMGQFSFTPSIRVLISMAGIVSKDAEHPDAVELHTSLSAEATTMGHPAHEHYRARYELVRSALSMSIARVRAKPALPDAPTDDELAAAFVAISDGLQLQWLYDHDAVEPAALLRRIVSAT